jgi:hypothetical protein
VFERAWSPVHQSLLPNPDRSLRPKDETSAPASRNADLEEPMKIYQALPDVHFRFTDTSRVTRRCGVCGIELQEGSPDPCRDAEPCNARTMKAGGRGKPEVVGVPCGVE